MVAGCWVGSIERWHSSSSLHSAAREGIEDLHHAIRIDAPDLPEKDRPRLLSQECFVHCACQYLRILNVVRLLLSPCHHLLVHRALPTLPRGLIEADVCKKLFHRATQPQSRKEHRRSLISSCPHGTYEVAKLFRLQIGFVEFLLEVGGPGQTIADVPRTFQVTVTAKPTDWTLTGAFSLPLLTLDTCTFDRLSLFPGTAWPI